MTAPLHTQPGTGTATARTALGPVVSARPGGKWKHPWQTTLQWAASGWVATVKPGFVNHSCPAVRTLGAQQRQDTGQPWGNNPLTGKPFFTDAVFGRSNSKASPALVDVPLYFAPALRLAWRQVGWDSGSDEAVPQYFLERGAAAAPNLDNAVANLDSGNALSSVPQAPAGLRLLRVCDLWVHQPRAALTSQVTLEPGLLTGLHNYTQTLSFTQPLANDALRVMSGTMQSAFSGAIDPLAQDYTEQPWDELLIARAYVLSPPGARLGAAPDATWTPYVSHAQFWNLTYVPGKWRQPLGGLDPGISLFVPLAGFVAQPVINVFTSVINDATQTALNAISAQSLAGTFYVATGGGSDAVFPPAPPAKAQGSTGADKTGRIQAQARAARATVSAATLDPGFPFRAAPFNPGVLTGV